VLGHAGLSLAYVCGNRGDAAASAERAVRLNPNLSSTQSAVGWIKVWLGEPDTAIEHFERAVRFNPIDPLIVIMKTGIAHAHIFARRYDEASASAEEILSSLPESIPVIRIAAASHAAAGQLERARHHMARLKQLYPDLRVSKVLGSLGPYRCPAHLAMLEDALRKAGLPE
jgi:tetratricopeptide (TPR) repeat protein